MTAVHEMMHTLGFVHEHTRPDRRVFLYIYVLLDCCIFSRDTFVKVNAENIMTGMEHNFEKRKQGFSDFVVEEGSVNAMNTPYDRLSLMHYASNYFSKNSEDTLTYLHQLSGPTWPEPDPEEPLSIIDQVLDLFQLFHIKRFPEVGFIRVLTGGTGDGVHACCR